jgi:glycerol-3-phosphate cytidylyltransferase
MKTVLTYGTFDLFHIGHVRLLRRLSMLGDKLIVGISTDEFNAIKGKSSFFSFEHRAEIVASCQYVSGIIPENNWKQKSHDIIRLGADIFAMGDDWAGKFDQYKNLCEVQYLPRTDFISTSYIKNTLSMAG